MDYFIKTLAPRLVQDLVTALAGYLAAHGYITADQTQSLIGAAFFIVMLIVNRIIGDNRKEKAAQAGGLAVAAASNDIPTSPAVVRSIIATAGITK